DARANPWTGRRSGRPSASGRGPRRSTSRCRPGRCARRVGRSRSPGCLTRFDLPRHACGLPFSGPHWPGAAECRCVTARSHGVVDTVGRVWYPWLTPQSESIVVAQIVLVPAAMRLTRGDLVTPDGSSPRVRRSLTELQDEHAKGNT